MTKWLKTRIRRWLQEADQVPMPLQGIDLAVSDDCSSFRSRPINMSLYRADGGWIVETTNHYESKISRDIERRTNLHIITDDQDLGEHLAKIIFTMQLIK